MQPRQATTFGVNFYGIHLPKWAVYAKLPKDNPGVVWVEDLKMVINQGHFVVYVMRPNYNRPRKMYVDGQDAPWYELALYIRNLPKDAIKDTIKPILNRDLRGCAPQMGKTQPFTGGGYYNSHKMTQTDATAGVVIGHRKYTNEGYWCAIMGCQTY